MTIEHVIAPAEVPGHLVQLGAAPIVKATAIEKHFDDHHVLRGCSMTVFPGETVTILGDPGQARARSCAVSISSRNRRRAPSISVGWSSRRNR